MDIFQQSIQFLGASAVFNDEGLFQCELLPDGGDHEQALFLTVFKNEDTLSLHMSITSPVELPTPMPDALAIAIGEHALEPFRGGFGVGLMPNSRRLSVYKVVSLAGKPEGYVQNVFQQLGDKIEDWHQFIEQISSQPESGESKPDGMLV